MPKEVRNEVVFRDVGGRTEITVTEFGWAVGQMMEIPRWGWSRPWYGDGSLWVPSWPGQGTSPGGLHRLDPASGSFVETFSLPPGRYGHEVVVAFDSVWSANFDADDIWRLGASP
jgi:hypothetical protein